MRLYFILLIFVLGGCSTLDCPPPVTLSKEEFNSKAYQEKCIVKGNDSALGVAAGAPFLVF